MTTPVERFIDALEKHDCRPKQCSGGWMATCPAHEDHNPSLSAKEGDDGRVLLHCHAGCEPKAILNSLGWTMRELMPDRSESGHPRPRNKKRTTKDKSREPQVSFATAEDAIAALERQKGKVSQTWYYTDAQGGRIGVILRWDRATGKDILPVSLHGGKWFNLGMADPN